MKTEKFTQCLVTLYFVLPSLAQAAAAESVRTLAAAPFDEVGFLIGLTLIGGMGLAVLAAILDNFQSFGRETFRRLETLLQARPGPITNIHIQEGARGTEQERPRIKADADRPPTEPGLVKARTFRVELATGLLPKIHQYVNEFLAQHGPENEAGGMLVGECQCDEKTGVVTFKLRGFIEAGPKADFSSGSILFDTEFQAQHLTALQLNHPVVNLGCCHRHPQHFDTCSPGDLATDREALQASGTKALVFVILTLNNPRQLLSSVRYREFKFDFYLMAEETGYQYQAIQPEIVELPLAEVNPELVALVTLRGFELRYDFALLQQLPKLTKLTVQAQEAAGGAILTAKFSDLTETFRLWLKPDGVLRLIVEGEEKQELPGPWTQPEVGSHVWLSHLLLRARHLLTTATPDGYQRHYGLLEDKNRLVAEVRAMQSAYGNRAVLRRNGEDLCWEYTVHQSGRAFPIKVVYPDQFPSQPPEITSVLTLPSSPHQLGSNRLCWINFYSRQSDWNPARDTAVTAIHAAHRWFACLLVYLTKGKWPDGAND